MVGSLSYPHEGAAPRKTSASLGIADGLADEGGNLERVAPRSLRGDSNGSELRSCDGTRGS
jgi:uncharacterized cupin superfamily protein